MLLSYIAMLALTRAEIVQRMRAPVVTQSEGLVRVFANCPEDMRREYQSPVARCAADTVTLLYRAEKMKSRRFERPRIIVHLGDVRTNVADVVARATTNDNEVSTRIYMKSPGGADVEQFRVEVTRAFYRALFGRELTHSEALEALRLVDPAYQIAERRARLEAWLVGDRRKMEISDDEAWDEEHLALLRKVLEVGVASRRDVRTFASRLYFYTPHFDERFVDGRQCVSFAEAIPLSRKDIRIRFLAIRKSIELSVFGSGRSPELTTAAGAYAEFLKELSKGEMDEKDLEVMLINADKLLQLAEGTAR